MNKIIAVSVGDVNGIGIHILLNAWKSNEIENFIIFTDPKKIRKYLKEKKIEDKVNIVNNEKLKLNYKKNKLNIYSFKSRSLEENTYKSLEYSYEFCKKKLCIGMVTLPIRKDLIIKNINNNFIGHTEYFQKLDKKKYSNMILFHKKIIVTPITTHVELKKVSKIISNKKYLYDKILSLYYVLINDFNIKKPKLIISGLNPHAGENGVLGKEEIKSIIPVINKLKSKRIYIDGPFSGDGMLLKNNLKKYNCFIFMFHDQALITFKYISQFSGVNYTGNLSIIRTSPDHGTAYNLIGSNKISNLSLLNCFKLVRKIYNNRINAKT